MIMFLSHSINLYTCTHAFSFIQFLVQCAHTINSTRSQMLNSYDNQIYIDEFRIFVCVKLCRKNLSYTHTHRRCSFVDCQLNLICTFKIIQTQKVSYRFKCRTATLCLTTCVQCRELNIKTTQVKQAFIVSITICLKV